MLGAAPFTRGSSRPSKIYPIGWSSRPSVSLAMHFAGSSGTRRSNTLLRAGRRALFASATGEAVECFEQALLALRRLPQTPETLQKALSALRLNSATALWLRGRSTKIRELTRSRRQRLPDQLGDQREGLGQGGLSLRCHYLWSVGELDAALDASQRALEIAKTVWAIRCSWPRPSCTGASVFLAQGESGAGGRRSCQPDAPGTRPAGDRAKGRPRPIAPSAIRLLVRSHFSPARSLSLGRFEGRHCLWRRGLCVIVEPTMHPLWAATALAGCVLLYFAQGRAHRPRSHFSSAASGMPHLQRQQLDSDHRGLARGPLRGHRAR